MTFIYQITNPDFKMGRVCSKYREDKKSLPSKVLKMEATFFPKLSYLKVYTPSDKKNTAWTTRKIN